jgi:twitching motility protein PilT
MQIGQSKFGMQTMNQALHELYAVKKLITLEEAMARSSDHDELKTMIANTGSPGSGGTGATARRQRE